MLIKKFLGGRVDEKGFHPIIYPDYHSAYPKDLTIKLRNTYRNPEVYRKWYRPTMLEIHVQAMNDPRFAHYLWKYNEYFSSELIIVGLW